MKTHCFFVIAAILAAFSASIQGQSSDGWRGLHLIPDSSIERDEDVGVRCHTNHLMLIMPDAVASSPTGLSPLDIREVYNLGAPRGSGVIAIVDAYDYPTALNDFNVFSKEYGLPQETSASGTASSNATFQVVYANGVRPHGNAGWNQEAALDIEWAHAMAPGAKIVLVEAASSSNSDLNAAIAKANSIAGVKEISMSWGSSEFLGELQNDKYLQQPGVVYFASSGDTGGRVIYPGASPYVVSAGGTTLNFAANGAFLSETGWSGSGGGKSALESRPSYQQASAVETLVGSSRGVPDCSFDTNPDSGVSVYDSTPYYGMSGWLVFGGTSVSAPSLAGIVNSAATARGSFQQSTLTELTLIYSNLGSPYFRDITQGSAGSHKCAVGWDFVTGAGSPLTLTGK
jgi:subtilase family serine protease